MNKKNWLTLFLACTIALTSFNSCKKSDDEDSTTDNGPTEWVKASAFDGDPRSAAAFFSIGDNGFITTGILKTNERVKDTWVFDSKASTWTKRADFPGNARNAAVGFSIDGVGYVGTGYDGTEALKDFYKFDVASNTWSPIAPLPADAEARYGAVAFSLGGFGYVGLGSTKADKTLKDFYKYDPTANTWTAVNTIFENKRVNAFSFVIGNKAYVGGGFDNNAFPEDFYSFDGTKWEKLGNIKTDDIDVTRQSASAFTVGQTGFVVGGRKSSILNTVWRYNPSNDSWESKHQAFQGSAREGAAAFSVNGKGYVATGANGSFKFDDNWVFTPVR